MKKYLIILSVLLASTSYSQPVIDSMLIDEMKGELHIYGKFAKAPGKVTVDKVQMQLRKWTDSLIFTSIPDTGKGMAGPVIVETLGIPSKPTMISVWQGSIYQDYYYQGAYPQERKHGLEFYLRMDLHSILKFKKSTTHWVQPTKRSCVYGYESQGGPDPHGGVVWNKTDARVYLQDTGVKYIQGFNCSSTFEPTSKSFAFDISNIKGLMGLRDSITSKGQVKVPYEYYVENFECGVSLDSNGMIIPYDHKLSDLENLYAVGRASEFLPPPKAFAIQHNPSIIAPPNHSTGIGTNDIILRWDALALMDKYHLQVSLDSTFNAQHYTQPHIQSNNTIVDTNIAETQYTLVPLSKNTKYFWRVSGVNSEGESRWSDVWNFTTGSKADVKEKFNSILTLSSYPNPSSNELNISYSLPESGNARIILYNLQGNVIRENIANGSENQLKWNISDLPNGSYILGLITDKERKTEIVKIVH